MGAFGTRRTWYLLVGLLALPALANAAGSGGASSPWPQPFGITLDLDGTAVRREHDDLPGAPSEALGGETGAPVEELYQLYPGAIELLSWLGSRGVPVGISHHSLP